MKKSLIGLLFVSMLGLMGCTLEQIEREVKVEYLGTDVEKGTTGLGSGSVIEDVTYAIYRLNNDSNLIVRVVIDENDRLEADTENYTIIQNDYDNVPVTLSENLLNGKYTDKELRKLKGTINMNGKGKEIKFVSYNNGRKSKVTGESEIKELDFLGVFNNDVNENKYYAYLGGLDDKVISIELKQYERYSEFINNLAVMEYDVVENGEESYIKVGEYWYPFEYTELGK